MRAQQIFWICKTSCCRRFAMSSTSPKVWWRTKPSIRLCMMNDGIMINYWDGGATPGGHTMDGCEILHLRWNPRNNGMFPTVFHYFATIHSMTSFFIRSKSRLASAELYWLSAGFHRRTSLAFAGQWQLGSLRCPCHWRTPRMTNLAQSEA